MSDYAPPPAAPAPVPRAVTREDVTGALRLGWRDFTRAPVPALFFGGAMALGGIVILWLLVAYRQPWMIVPVAIGFPLVGPFLAAGTYEISRRLDTGEPVTLPGVLGVAWRQGTREFGWMAFVVLFVFWMWMYQARILIALFLDMGAFASPGTLAGALFATADGWTMMAIGTVTGGVLALVLFATTAIAMPLLVDRELDIVTAIVTSWRTVLASPGPMLLWGAVVGALTLLAMVPMFLGLTVAFPVLGFATWHLFRRAIPRA